jgi:hypothetical protein
LRRAVDSLRDRLIYYVGEKGVAYVSPETAKAFPVALFAYEARLMLLAPAAVLDAVDDFLVQLQMERHA